MRATRQKGSLKRVRRPGGLEVWVFRWRETETKRARKLVIGSVQKFRSESAAMQKVLELNLGLPGLPVATPRPQTVEELVKHFEKTELPTEDDPDGEGRAFSTKDGYRGYLRKWIVPRWGKFPLTEVKAVAVEEWLRGLMLVPKKKGDVPKRASRGTKKKIRDIMHVLYEHAIRYEWIDKNPITAVRQSGKRESTPDILEVDELVMLVDALPIRERIAVFLDFGIGARRGELQGVKWEDFDFEAAVLQIKRSIVKQHIGKPKTEVSAKPIPLSPSLIDDMLAWRRETPYARDTDYVFASPLKKGKQPYWMSRIMQHNIKPVAAKLGINKRISWHTLRRTYATLLQGHNDDPKVVQELLRHASIKMSMDVYAQAITEKKRQAQNNVVEMVAKKKQPLSSLTAEVAQ